MAQKDYIRRANKRRAKALGIYENPAAQPSQSGQPRPPKKRRIRPMAWEKRGEESHADAAARLERERVEAQKEASASHEAVRFCTDGVKAESMDEGRSGDGTLTIRRVKAEPTDEGSKREGLAEPNGLVGESSGQDVFDTERAATRVRELAEQLGVIAAELQDIAVQSGARMEG